MRRILILMSASIAVALALGCTGHHSSYVGDQARTIKSMSDREISDTLAGKGMGLARAAELNGYPGPMHVLELATALHLTPDQRQRTEILFRDMQARAIDAGKALIAEEQALDRHFASRTITLGTLNESLMRVGALQAQVRAVHLAAHLAQTEILTPEQVNDYAARRGYALK
jgi:hypothetical protein